MTILKNTIVLILALCSLSIVYATEYSCPDPHGIQVTADPKTKVVTWRFHYPMAAQWIGRQTFPDPTKTFSSKLPVGTTAAIRLDYGKEGDSWPIPRLTCYYLGDNKTTASGFISSYFFTPPVSTPSIYQPDYVKVVGCQSDPTQCVVQEE